MPEVKTLQFLNTPEGQARKNEALGEHLQAGWTIVSETVTPGHMKGKQACCLAFICLPFGFAAGRTDGVISVTLQRSRNVVSANHSVKVATTNSLSQTATTKPLSQLSRRALLGLIGLFCVVFLFGLCQKGKSPQVAKSEKEESKAVTPAPPQDAFTLMSPVQHLNEAKKALSEWKPNKDPMKTYWGRVAEAQEHLVAIPKHSPEWKTAQPLVKELDRRNSEISRLAAIGARQMLAELVERNYLDKGMDVSIELRRPDKTEIRMKYVLFSRPLVHQLTRDSSFVAGLREAGFKKIVFTDGYDQTWSVDID